MRNINLISASKVEENTLFLELNGTSKSCLQDDKSEFVGNKVSANLNVAWSVASPKILLSSTGLSLVSASNLAAQHNPATCHNCFHAFAASEFSEALRNL